MNTILSVIKMQELEVLIFKNRVIMGDQAAKDVAECILDQLESKAELNMIFAAAPSQNDFLEGLLKHNLPWHKINAFHMDEYVGLHSDASQGFGNFLRERIFDKVPFKSIHYLNGGAADLALEGERYADLLKKYPVDIVCMGIGENGHIAFNDPPVADFNDPLLVKKVELDAICRMQQVNDGCFSALADVPTEALTLTIPALMRGRYIFSIVPGSTKSIAIENTLSAPIDESCPATILRNHKNARLYLDQQSGISILKNNIN